MNYVAAFVGRIMLAIIFIVSGANKLFDPASADAMITAAGLPRGLGIPTGIFEVVAGLALVLGFMTRLFAILLAGFCLLTILFFHREFTDPMQAVQAMKNLAIAGGLLCLFAHSQMRWSYDSMRLQRRAEIATRDADARIHDAEVRAARAEGRVAGVTTDRAVVTDVDGDGRPEVRRRRWFGF